MYPTSNLSALAAEERTLRNLQVVTSQSLPPVGEWSMWNGRDPCALNGRIEL